MVGFGIPLDEHAEVFAAVLQPLALMAADTYSSMGSLKRRLCCTFGFLPYSRCSIDGRPIRVANSFVVSVSGSSLVWLILLASSPPHAATDGFEGDWSSRSMRFSYSLASMIARRIFLSLIAVSCPAPAFVPWQGRVLCHSGSFLPGRLEWCLLPWQAALVEVVLLVIATSFQVGICDLVMLASRPRAIMGPRRVLDTSQFKQIAINRLSLGLAALPQTISATVVYNSLTSIRYAMT